MSGLSAESSSGPQSQKEPRFHPADSGSEVSTVTGKMELSIAHHASRSPPRVTAYTAIVQTATPSQPRAHPGSQRTLHYGIGRHTLPASLSGTVLEGRMSATGARSLRPTVTRCWPHLEPVSYSPYDAIYAVLSDGYQL